MATDVCANRKPHTWHDAIPEEIADVQEVTYMLFGLDLTIPLCADCRRWFAKFYREAVTESNRGK